MTSANDFCSEWLIFSADDLRLTVSFRSADTQQRTGTNRESAADRCSCLRVLLHNLRSQLGFAAEFRHVLTQSASDEWQRCREHRAAAASADCGSPSLARRAGGRMKPRLNGDGRPPASRSGSRFLGSTLLLSVLVATVSCHGTCRHRVPAPSEVSLGLHSG